MKKNYSIYILFVCYLAYVTLCNISCKKINENKSHQEVITKEKLISSTQARGNSALISIDTNFVILTNETYEFLDFLEQVAKHNSLILDSLTSKLKELNNRNLPFEDQLRAINEIFREDISDRLIHHLEIFSYNWKAFHKKFPDFSQEELNDAVLEVLKNNPVLNAKAISFGCGWGYTLCCVGATAAAVVCHAACDGTAIATTAGLGIPACVALCGTIQVSAMAGCYNDYCD